MLRDIWPFYGCPNRPYFTFRLQLLHLYQGGLDDVGIIRWVMYLIDVYVIGFKLSQRFFEIVAYQRNVLQRIALSGFCSDDDIVSNPHAIKSIANAFLRIEIHASGIDEIAAGIQIGLDDRFGLGFTDRAITNATDSPGSQSQLRYFDPSFYETSCFDDSLLGRRIRLMRHFLRSGAMPSTQIS